MNEENNKKTGELRINPEEPLVRYRLSPSIADLQKEKHNLKGKIKNLEDIIKKKEDIIKKQSRIIAEFKGKKTYRKLKECRAKYEKLIKENDMLSAEIESIKENTYGISRKVNRRY